MPASLVFASAATVDGHKVWYAWRGSDSRDTSFTNTVVSSTAYNTLRIQTDIVLSEPVKANEAFDLSVAINHSTAGSVVLDSVVLYDDANTRLGTFYGSISNGKINITSMQVDQVVSYVRLIFTINRPTWIVENIVEYVNFTIGTTPYYKAEKYTTWGDWVSTSYNTLGLFVDDIHIFSTDSQLYHNGLPVTIYDTIYDSFVYDLVKLETNSEIVFYFNDMGYTAIDGMTWAQFVESEYNVLGDFYIEGQDVYCYELDENLYYPDESVVKASDVIIAEGNYYDLAYLWNVTGFALVNYLYDFEVASVSVEVQDEKGLLNGIIGWLKNVWTSIKELPAQIGETVGQKLMQLGEWLIEKIKGLFVPDQDTLLEILDQFDALLQDRFGMAYDATQIIDDFASAFKYSDSKSKVTFPSVTVRLAGTDFTFGGWEVNLVPVGFEALVDSLKFIVNIVCTFAFVMVVRKRYEEVFR